MNHARFMISPELHVVQDRVQGLVLHLTWCRTGGRKEEYSDEEMPKVSNQE
jgi:hypothetical protein